MQLAVYGLLLRLSDGIAVVSISFDVHRWIVVGLPLPALDQVELLHLGHSFVVFAARLDLTAEETSSFCLSSLTSILTSA